MLTLNANFKAALLQPNTPSFIAKFTESEVYAEATSQTDWLASKQAVNVDLTTEPGTVLIKATVSTQIITTAYDSLLLFSSVSSNLSGVPVSSPPTPGTDSYAWQSFKQSSGQNRYIDKIKLHLFAAGVVINLGAFSNTFYVQLYATKGGATISTLKSVGGAGYVVDGLVAFDFSAEHIDLVSGTTYWIKVYAVSTAVSSNAYSTANGVSTLRFHTATTTYADGQLDGKSYNAANVDNRGDAAFAVTFLAQPQGTAHATYQLGLVDVPTEPGEWRIDNLTPQNSTANIRAQAYDTIATVNKTALGGGVAATFESIADNGSRMVRVSATTPFMQYSDNRGATWTTAASGAFASVSVTWTGTRFVAVSNTTDVSKYSTNGSDWISGGLLPASGTWRLVWTETTLVAAMYGGNGATSTDGAVTWTARAMAAAVKNWNAIAWNGTNILAVEYASTYAASSDAAGITWTQRTLATNGVWRGIAHGAGLWVVQEGVAVGFSPLGQTVSNWYGMAAAPNGDVYACVYDGDIYKQAGGGGGFSPLAQAARSWACMAAAPNGDVYAGVNTGSVYKQTAGGGAFLDLVQTARQWRGMAAAPSGDVYACVYGGYIYRNFSQITQTIRGWHGMAAAPNGDVYACVYDGDIYKQAGGGGDFSPLAQTARSWHGMAAAPNGDVYACVFNGDIYKQTAGAGNFIALAQTVRAWSGMAAAPNGDVYACVWNGDIYKQAREGYNTSPDMATWTARTHGSALNYRGIAHNKNVFVATGLLGYAFSVSGTAWTYSATGEAGRAIIPIDGRFYAVAVDGYAYSHPGHTELGIVVDAQPITVIKQYYAFTAFLAPDTTGSWAPSLLSVMVYFGTYLGFSTTPEKGYAPAITAVSSLQSSIDPFKESTVGQITLTMALSKDVSKYLKTKFPRNKEVRVFAGFTSLAEADYIDYYRGNIEDWSFGQPRTVSISLRDFHKTWNGTPVPKKWVAIADDLTWTNWHPVDVMLDILHGYAWGPGKTINQTSFATVKTARRGWVVTNTLTGKTFDAKELLEELRFITGTYFIPQPNGRIKLKHFDKDEAAVVSLSDDDMIGVAYKGNSASLVNLVNWYYNMTTEGKAKTGGIALHQAQDGQSQFNWGEKKSFEFKDYWSLTAAGIEQVQPLANALMMRFAAIPNILNFELDLMHIALELADMVNITTKISPSTDLGTTSNVKYQIVRKDIDFLKSRIKFEVLRVA